MPLKTFKLTDASELTKQIGQIGKRKVAMDNAVQAAAVQCIAQSIVHRNSTPAHSLYDALAGSMRRDALVKYFELYGNLVWDKEKKRITFRDNKREETDEYLEKVAAVVWHTVKKEPTIKSEFDGTVELEKFFSRVHAMVKRGTKLVNGAAFEKAESAFRHAQAEAFIATAKADEAGTSPNSGVDPEKAKQAASKEQLAALAAQFGGQPPALATGTNG